MTELHDTDRVRKACVGSMDPVFISDGGKEEMVLLDMNLYRQPYAKLQVYQQLEEGERDIAEGRVVDGYANLAALNALLRTKSPDFDHRKYGYAQFLKLLRAVARFELEELGDNKVLMVRDTQAK